ncbi:MAG TPA: DUF2157 domain-containing protein [Smithellaceae bacterium]|mgnify:FL=1|nr:DUF2157 domain-containing protein [Smithellaceae bacterium]
MTLSNLIRKMQSEQKLGEEQAGLLLDLQKKRIFPIHRELRFFLYAGILLVVAGTGLTIKQYFDDLGDVAIISALTLCFVSAFAYCFIKGHPYDSEEVPSPHLFFDYLLFFGCTFFAMDIAYMEMRFSVLGDAWKSYLLLSAVLFFFLSYRFDNRLVLSMALSTLAAWFGFTLSEFQWFLFSEHCRLYAMAYGTLVFFGGFIFYRLEIKKHFFEIYLNFALHFLCIALITGVGKYLIFSIYFPALLAACAALAFYATRVSKFSYLLYAIIYGYIGVSIVVVDFLHRSTLFTLIYFILSSLLVIRGIYKMSRKFREEQ